MSNHTFQEYLELEELSPNVKHEYVDGVIYAMAGGTPAHAALAQAVGYLLVRHLAGGPCRAFSSDLRIRIEEADAATYADATVVCGPLELDPDSPSHVTNPRVVVEVVSPSTEDYDRNEKRSLYALLPTLVDYDLVAQDVAAIEVWSQGDGQEFHRAVSERGDAVALESIGLTFDVDELYALAGVAQE